MTPKTVRSIEPVTGPLHAEVVVPGSKSITNRALLTAGLAAGTSRLPGALVADDTQAMAACMSALGASVTVEPDTSEVAVTGIGGRLPAGPRTLHAGQSGTTARFVAAVGAAGSGPYTLDGDTQMRRRPMGPLFAALRALGAGIEETGEAGHLPAVISGPARGGTAKLPGDTSSQFLSGLLLAGPLWPDGVRIELTTPLVSRPYAEMTAAVMARFGAPVETGSSSYAVPAGGAGYRAVPSYRVEPDASAASYFWAAGALCGGRVRVLGLAPGALQGDVRFVDVLEAMGADVVRDAGGIAVGRSGALRGVDVDLADLSDTAPTLAVVAALAEGPTTVRGIGFVRGKESDRIAAVVSELRRCGVGAEERPDGFVVHPAPLRPARIRTYDDHRMAMSFAVLGLAQPGIEIEDPDCVAKTYPGFWDDLEQLRG